MSKRKTRNGRRQTTSPRREPTRPGKPKATFWHNRKIWLAGAIGTVVTGVVTGILVNVSDNVLAVHNIAGPPAPTPPSLVEASASSTVSNHGFRTSRSASTGPPLTVVSEDPINLDHAGVWVFPGKVVFASSELKTLNTYPPGIATPPFMNLLFSLGAYQAQPDTQLVVQNNQAQEIRVLDMSVVKSCQAPLTGTLIYSPDAGADPSIQLGFDLDSADTEAETGVTGIEAIARKPDYFAGHTVSIQPRAQQVFDIVTVTSKHSCSFRFMLTLLVGSKKTYQLIGDGSQPFRISAIVGTRDSGTTFSAYGVIYAGGVASPTGDDRFGRVNPKTYKGY
jgi:hypothetical protein